ncbi:multiple epidermal growth factor-like domains protein 10 isoform X3 [Mya arenaria]|nr:multiple epidermal growth factor-like domains protein 10 isoform X3 [Mya arenaria]
MIHVQTIMILYILALICVSRLCIAATVFVCVCCKGGEERCGYQPGIGDNYCFDGCVDGIKGHRCHNPCVGNCYSCDQDKGNPCQSCKDSYYNTSSNCSKNCSVGCESGKCNDDGTCSPCRVGFDGNTCRECIQGKYGATCSMDCFYQNCHCTTSNGCDSCKPGFYDKNTFCQTPCSPGCQNVVCNEDGSCECISKFQGDKCNECSASYYGTYCNELCSVGCENRLCSKNGTCTCSSNFKGTACDTCADNRYGENCDKVCNVGCSSSFCDRNNGFCKCLPNFTGDSCDQCKPGFYGQSCNKLCSNNCIGGKCLKDVGKCIDGCVSRYTGDNCSSLCDSTCATCLQNDKLHCMSCNNGNTGTTCQCPPNCDCVSGSDKCESCAQGYANPVKQCKCQSQYCSGISCSECINNTYYNDNGACCKCPENCKDGVCNSGTECTSGCIDGFYSLDCSKRCASIGANCLKCNKTDGNCLSCNDGLYPHENGTCISCNSNCKNGQCNSTTGECTNGCTEQFWGNKCDLPCNSNCETCQKDSGICVSCANKTFHGNNCNEPCSSICFETKCKQSTGDCLNGCSGEFYGNLCERKCPENCLQSDTGTSCNNIGHCNNGCIDGFEEADCTVQTKPDTANPPIAAIVGGVSGGVVVIIGVAVAIFFFRRRSIRLPASNKSIRNSHTSFQANIADVGEKKSSANERTYYNEGQIKRQSTKSKQTVIRPSASNLTSTKNHSSTHVVNASKDEIDLDKVEESNGDLVISSKNDQMYYNEPELSSYKSKIPIGQLVKYVDGKSHGALSEEFEKFSLGLVKPYVESQKRENMSKNRYKGIYPYDDSRVKVTGDGGSDYINASFIDGYKKPKQYIATLGPMSQQLDDFSLFWKMIWQQRVEKIVMVTNLIEHGSPKCEQYWPNPGASKMYGEIKVESRSEDEYAEFTRRALTMTMGTEERTLHHLHFTCWPDKAIPDDVTAMIEFRQRVLSTPNTLNGPTVVHCSAGVGRTGTYIALDILTKEGEAERAIDIAGCVHKMRLNRPNMVQTVEQYQFLHTAVVYSLTFDCKQIKGENFDQFMKKHTSQELNSQFKRLQHTVEKRTKDEAIAVECNKQHLSKNRANADIPGNENRPRLYLHLKPGAADYINAVYIHSFRVKKRYLVAQTPLPETVIDFLTLVVQESCSCIVSFEADMDKQKNIGIYYPAANQEVLKQGTFQVSCSREEKKTFYAERTLTIQHKGVGTSTERTIPHLQYTDWDETNNIPRSTTNFLSFLNVIENVTRQSGDGPILVHCLDGAGKSGLFCVVSLLLHKMAVEHEVSVLNSVRKVKTMRRLAIPNQEQFSFCHGCVSEYLSSFDVYANFNEETGRL